VTVALVTTELYLRLFLPQPLGLSYRAPSGLTLNIPGASVRYRRSEFDNRIDINSLGLRDREISVAKPPGVFRILVLGDSFAEGKQVPLQETFPKQLERALGERFPRRRWEVVNGGVSGYGTADEIKFFEVLGSALTPDVVILAFCVGNDIQNNVASPYFRRHEERLEERPLLPPSAAELWLARAQEFGASHFHLYQFLRDRYHRTVSRSPDSLEESPDAVSAQAVAPIDDDGWRLTEALLDRLRGLIDDAGARLFLVAIPQRAQVFDHEWVASTGLPSSHPARIELQLRFAAYARQRLQPFLDLLTDLHDASMGRRTYFRIDGHFNALGHRVAAEAILESLVKFNLLGETR
jgi:lysophospholipase L1-like esterase